MNGRATAPIACSRCHEINPPFAASCIHCGQPLSASGAAHAATPAPSDASDLPALLWTTVCLFIAFWGLVAAGPLHGLLGIATHPYTLIAVTGAALLVSCLYLIDSATRSPKPAAMLSTRDLMALTWTAAAMISIGQIVRLLEPARPVISRYEPAAPSAGGCRVDVYVVGREGDELWRLTGLAKGGGSIVVGAVVRRPGGGSFHLPETQHTPNGDCAIAKYHLIVRGKEVDSVEGAAP